MVVVSLCVFVVVLWLCIFILLFFCIFNRKKINRWNESNNLYDYLIMIIRYPALQFSCILHSAILKIFHLSKQITSVLYL